MLNTIIEINLEKWQWFFYLVAIIVALFLIVWLYKKVHHFFRAMVWSKEEKDLIRKRWNEIEKHLESGAESGFRLAILEADKLLDYVLKQRFMPGETLAERLKYAQYKYPKLQKVWWAHKVRNDLVHEATFTVSENLAKKVINSFREALREIGAL